MAFNIAPTPINPDLQFVNLGLYVLMKPLTDTAIDWIVDTLDANVLVLRGAIVVDPACLPAIVTAARAAALIVEG